MKSHHDGILATHEFGFAMHEFGVFTTRDVIWLHKIQVPVQRGLVAGYTEASPSAGAVIIKQQAVAVLARADTRTANPDFALYSSQDRGSAMLGPR